MSNLNERQFSPYWHHGGGGSWLSVPTTQGSMRGQGRSSDHSDVGSFMTPPESFEHNGMVHLDDASRAEGTDAQRYLSHIGGSGIDIPSRQMGRRPDGARNNDAASEIVDPRAEQYGPEQYVPDENARPDPGIAF